MKKAKKIIAAIALVMSVIMCVGILCGCVEDPKRYTLEQHMERISERVEKRYFKEDTTFTGYKLYPLYNANEELSYFLVEFEPYGFVFVRLNFQANIFYPAMYKRYDSYLNESWRRYRVCVDGNEPEQYEGKAWLKDNDSQFENERYETDGEGNFIEYNHSPYAIANVLDQKLYLLDVYKGYVPAVKYNGKFINLVSIENFEFVNDVAYYKELSYKNKLENIPIIWVTFYPEPHWTL